MVIENIGPPELEAAVERARGRAAKSGGLHPGVSNSPSPPVASAVAEFVTQILTDGTYAQVVEHIGQEDPDLANI